MLNRAVMRRGKATPPDSEEELEILPEALARLRAAGYHLAVVTNQLDSPRHDDMGGGGQRDP